MSRSTLAFILLLVCLVGLLGYNYFERPFSKELGLPEASPVASSSPQAVVDPTFEQLTTEQRVALILAAPITIPKTGSVDADQLAWIKNHQPGVVTIFGDAISTQSAQQAVAELSSPEYKPLLAVDHEGGTVQRLSGAGFTVLPSWQKLCAMPVAQRQELLNASSTELKKLGIDIVFAPVIDLTASGSALGSRTCNSSPELVAQRSQDFVETFSAKHIMPVLKHFPGIGSVRRDLHDTAVSSAVNENELLVYQYILSTYPDIGVMVAHISIEGIGGDVCSLNPDCIQGFKKLFNKALVFTDALDMKSADGDQTASDSAEVRSLAERAVLATKAGDDVLVFGRAVNVTELDAIFAELLKQYAEDEEVRTAIDSSAQRVYELKKKYE
jgi:beta-N-acetylhexosaminidase